MQKSGLLNLEKTPVNIGQVLSIGGKDNRIFNLFIKETFNSKLYLQDLEAAVETLKEALNNEEERKTFSMAREGNGFDKTPWNLIERVFRTVFAGENYKITICTGEIEIPREDRLIIIEECHDSTVGGHKGETKTLERIKERY